MAILEAMPQESIISGFKGKIDFYYWLGIPVCRTWPRPPSAPRSPNVTARYAPFGYINSMAKDLPEYLRDQYRQAAQGTGLTWKDYMVRAYMGGIDY